LKFKNISDDNNNTSITTSHHHADDDDITQSALFSAKNDTSGNTYDETFDYENIDNQDDTYKSDKKHLYDKTTGNRPVVNACIPKLSNSISYRRYKGYDYYQNVKISDQSLSNEICQNGYVKGSPSVYRSSYNGTNGPIPRINVSSSSRKGGSVAAVPRQYVSGGHGIHAVICDEGHGNGKKDKIQVESGVLDLSKSDHV